MKPDRAWVLLPSGQQLDLLAPDAESWTDRDLAISLSRAYRWGGHSKWDLPLSVAQHSLLVLVIRQQMQALQKLTQAEALRELLHDAEEAFLCFDPISPLKPHLGEAFGAVTGRLHAAMDHGNDSRQILTHGLLRSGARAASGVAARTAAARAAC